VVYGVLTNPIAAQYWRIYPTLWNSQIALRTELFGLAPLGGSSGGSVGAFGWSDYNMQVTVVPSSIQSIGMVRASLL